MQPQIGNWRRVVSGPHRAKVGVVDRIVDYPVGTRYRLTNTAEVVGWFAADQLEPADSPNANYVSRVDVEVRQQALDVLTGGRVRL